MKFMVMLFVVAFAAAPGVAHAADAPAFQAEGVDYELGPGDLISIRVSGLREFEMSARVSNSGRIHVPYVGVMFAAGMTSVELERDIARMIKEHELINEPQVRVQIEQHRARPVYVVGEVDNPGQFVITNEMYLLDLVSKAGGLLPSAAQEAMLYRRNAPEPSVQARIIDPTAAESTTPAASPAAVSEAPLRATASESTEAVIRVELDDLQNGTRPEANLRLQGGDVLFVPRRQQQNIYIVGNVITPGAYTLPRRGQLTATQALIYAGGPMPTAKTENAFIMRHDETGVRQAIPFDFGRIIEGKDPDIPIRADDILFVPTSNVKSIGIGLLNLVPRLLQQFLIF